jgi:hypothetical protein
LGAAAALREATCTYLTSVECAATEQLIAMLQQALGDAAFTTQMAAGRLLSVEQAYEQLGGL